MWNGTHTKACNLNGYESVMCLTVFDSSGLYIGFPVLWVLCYNYLVARIGFIRISCFMIILPYLFIPALTYLPPEYFLLDITWYMHYCAHPASPLGFASTLAWGVSFDSPGFSRPGPGARSVWISPFADQSSAAVAWTSSRPSWATSFQAPLWVSRVFLFKLVSTFMLFYSCTSACIPAFAHISDMIFM